MTGNRRFTSRQQMLGIGRQPSRECSCILLQMGASCCISLDSMGFWRVVRPRGKLCSRFLKQSSARQDDSCYLSAVVATRFKFSMVLAPGGRPRRGEARRAE